MKTFLKRVAQLLPVESRQALKRHYFARKIRAGDFSADEPEFELLSEFIAPGDWAIDVGANIGNYSVKMSQLVGAEGRVIAFEPVSETFELLAANCALANWRNISLVNAAVSDRPALLGMDIPVDDGTGAPNFYQAHLTDTAKRKVLCLSVDSLQLPHSIQLIKIDAEGHELSVLKGMHALLTRDQPILIVEGDQPEVEAFLSTLGYGHRKLPGSWNRVYESRHARG